MPVPETINIYANVKKIYKEGKINIQIINPKYING
jgi:hypothetical protein